MPDFLQTHSSEWLEYFARAGFPSAEPLGAGVEGAVYRLGDGQVAKVWGNRRYDDLLRMQAFYDDVGTVDLGFATPEIVRVEQVEATTVTFERELQGTPLQQSLGFEDEEISPAAADCVVEVLAGLRAVSGTDAMKRLPVLGEEAALWQGAPDFASALIGLLDRRVAKFGDLLRSHVADFDAQVRAHSTCDLRHGATADDRDSRRSVRREHPRGREPSADRRARLRVSVDRR